MKLLWATVLLCCLTTGLAQQDLIEFIEDDRRLVYVMDYGRLQEFAEAQSCTQESFELGLLHTALRTLLLFLPFEAEFYSEVDILEVRAMTEGDIVLLMRAPLKNIKTSMNTRFRASLQGYASARSGHCFALAYAVMQPWLKVVEAQGGVMQVDATYLALEIEAATDIDLSALASSARDDEAAFSAPTSLEDVDSEPSIVTETSSVIEVPTEPVESNQGETSDDTSSTADNTAINPLEADTVPKDYFIPDGYTLIPFLSNQRTLEFNSAGASIEPNRDYLAVLETSKGIMILDLDEVNAPRTVNNFIFLARHHYYDGVPFHRVIRNFMAQTGDPTGTGRGGPGYQFADEFSPRLRHDEKGIVSMANSGPDTNGSQFFITFTATEWLDDDHTVFGRLLIGYDVLESINIIDPEEPSVIVPAISSLADIASEGIFLSGDAETAILGYLRKTFGAVPDIGEPFDIDGYRGVVGINPETGAPLVGFWAEPDVIERLYIVQREGL